MNLFGKFFKLRRLSIFQTIGSNAKYKDSANNAKLQEFKHKIWMAALNLKNVTKTLSPLPLSFLESSGTRTIRSEMERSIPHYTRYRVVEIDYYNRDYEIQIYARPDAVYVDTKKRRRPFFLPFGDNEYYLPEFFQRTIITEKYEYPIEFHLMNSNGICPALWSVLVFEDRDFWHGKVKPHFYEDV